MSDDKKDLTRIEDLGEFIHELNEESSNDFSFEESPPEIPEDDLDTSDSFKFESSEESTFESSEESTFESSEESTFESSEKSTFESSEESTFGSSEEPTFESSEESNFGSSEESTFESNNSFDEETFQKTIIESPSENFSPNFEEDLIESSTTISPQAEIEIQEVKVKIPLVEEQIVNNSSFHHSENFEDIKKFAENSSFTDMAAEGNPSFSVLLAGIKYQEDAQDILRLLKELNLLIDSEENTYKKLLRGHFLIPRISEYAAIYASHKLRKFQIDIQVGLSDEIHPPKHGLDPEIGLTSKSSLLQNQSHQFHFEHAKIDLSQIILATTPTIEGYQIIRYIGIISEHELLDSDDLNKFSDNHSSQNFQDVYLDLANKLKPHAVENTANAIVGINYQLTPLPLNSSSSQIQYKLSCTGNLVWINKL